MMKIEVQDVSVKVLQRQKMCSVNTKKMLVLQYYLFNSNLFQKVIEISVHPVLLL